LVERTGLLGVKFECDNAFTDIKLLVNLENHGIRFSIVSSAAWAPGVESCDAWLAWANGDLAISAGVSEPPVKPMAPMLRRRAGFLSKMALEVAYQCMGKEIDVPTVFCSRHGEARRSVDLLMDLAKTLPLSPTSFGLSVHNATAGIFSIARGDHTNSIALAAGQSSVEHAMVEVCGLLADGEPKVLLVVYDCPLPRVYRAFQDCNEQPFAWAWLIQSPTDGVVSLCWSSSLPNAPSSAEELSPGLEILRFYLRKDSSLERICDGRRWQWSRDA
jgi:beta-ketoacyl synthase-like protein